MCAPLLPACVCARARARVGARVCSLAFTNTRGAAPFQTRDPCRDPLLSAIAVVDGLYDVRYCCLLLRLLLLHTDVAAAGDASAHILRCPSGQPPFCVRVTYNCKPVAFRAQYCAPPPLPAPWTRIGRGGGADDIDEGSARRNGACVRTRAWRIWLRAWYIFRKLGCFSIICIKAKQSVTRVHVCVYARARVQAASVARRCVGPTLPACGSRWDA